MEAAGLQGGESSNTHPANRQEGEEKEPSTPLQTGGEDMAYVALGVKWDAFEPLMESLTAAKEEAQRRHAWVPVVHGGRLIAVKPAGTKSGGGSGMFYPFTLVCDGFLLRLADSPAPVEWTPNVIAELGSTLLMSSGGLRRAWPELCRLLGDLGGGLLWNKLSRVDLCADLTTLDIQEVTELVRLRHGVTRARGLRYFEDSKRWTGVQVGRGDIVLRIYDKAHEVLRAKPDKAKHDLLVRYRWGTKQESAVRVEFQLRRAAYKSAGISSVEDYYRWRAALVVYLCEEWFRIAALPPDRVNNNTQRCDSHPLWSSVQTAFSAWTGQDATSFKRVHRPIQRDPVRSVKQAFGCLLGAVADLRDGAELTPGEFIQEATSCLEWNLEGMSLREFVNRYQKKALPRRVEGQRHDA